MTGIRRSRLDHTKRAYTGAVRGIWKKIRYRLEWLALAGAAKIVPLLSRNACYRLAQIIGALAATVDRAGRRVALSNLQVAFGDELSPGRRNEIVRESYQHFARTMIDLFWSPRLTSENYSRYIDVVNLDLWQEETKPGEARHLCLLPLQQLRMDRRGGQLFRHGKRTRYPRIQESVAQPDLCQPARKQRSTGDLPARSGAPTFQDAAPRRTRRDPDRPDHSRAVADGGHRLFRIENERDLRARVGASTRRRDDHQRSLRTAAGGRYRIVFHPRIEFPPDASFQEIAQACWDQFEPFVRANPAPWLWMYKHWRYRPIAADPAVYPFYANISEFSSAASRKGQRTSSQCPRR